MNAVGVVVELHFQLHFNPAVLPIDVKSVVHHGVSMQFGNVQLMAMPTDLQFIFLATHGARHEWERLQWVYDIAQLVDRASDVEIGEWLSEAARHRLTNPAVQALVLAQRLFEIILPTEVTRAYKRSLRIRYMVRRAELALRRDPGAAEEEPEQPFKLGRRLYRLCVTSNPEYLWHELRNGFKAMLARVKN